MKVAFSNSFKRAYKKRIKGQKEKEVELTMTFINGDYLEATYQEALEREFQLQNIPYIKD